MSFPKARLTFFAIVLGACSSAATSPGAGDVYVPGRCDGSNAAHLAVHHTEHELLLCDRGHAIRRFDVRLARNGTGKTTEGDGKLPLGRYSLAEAVPSQRFGQFLLVGYPTAEQRARGLTGSAVGVHGPAREARWLGGLVNTFDTTEGCIGLAYDDEVHEIADFVHRRGAHLIVID